MEGSYLWDPGSALKMPLGEVEFGRSEPESPPPSFAQELTNFEATSAEDRPTSADFGATPCSGHTHGVSSERIRRILARTRRTRGDVDELPSKDQLPSSGERSLHRSSWARHSHTGPCRSIFRAQRCSGHDHPFTLSCKHMRLITQALNYTIRQSLDHSMTGSHEHKYRVSHHTIMLAW